MKELIKEKRLLEEKKEEELLLNAIHRQAKDRYYFEKGKNYLKTKKAQKKNANKLLEFIVCSVLVILPMSFLLLALIVAN